MNRLAWHPIAAVAGTLLLLSGCAVWRNPMQVNVVDVQALPGEGLEMRMAVKLRIQNPSDTAIAYHGVAIALEVRGNTFATGVGNSLGTVPPFGESLLTVPVSISAMAAVRQALDMAADPTSRFDYVLHGELATDDTGGARFESRGQIALPPGLLSP